MSWNLTGGRFEYPPPKSASSDDSESDNDSNVEDTEEPELEAIDMQDTAEENSGDSSGQCGVKRKYEEPEVPEAKRLKSDPCSCPCHSSSDIFVHCICSCGAVEKVDSNPPAGGEAATVLSVKVPQDNSGMLPVIMPLPALQQRKLKDDEMVVLGSTPLTLLKMAQLLVRVYSYLGLDRRLEDLQDEGLQPTAKPSLMHPLAPQPSVLLEELRSSLQSLLDDVHVEGAPNPVAWAQTLVQRLQAAEAQLLQKFLPSTFEDIAGCSFLSYITSHISTAVVPPSPVPGLQLPAAPKSVPACMDADLLLGSVRAAAEQVQAEISPSPTGLALLHAIEQAVVASLCLQSFRETGYTSLAAFAAEHPEAACCIPLGGTAVPSQEVDLFIAYCGAVMGALYISAIESTAQQHFRISSFSALGLGPCGELVQLHRRHSPEYLHSLRVSHAMAAPLCWPHAIGSIPSNSVEELQVVEDGIDGSDTICHSLSAITKEQALATLLHAPCLLDLAQWTQWEVMLLPTHGPLSDFIVDHLSTKGEWQAGARLVRLLQCTQGTFVWVDAEPSEQRLKDAIETGLVWETATQLVSLVVKYGGLARCPVALLAKTVKIALHQLESSGPVPLFVLKVIMAIPLPMQTSAVVQQLLLEPMHALHPSHSGSMLTHCQTPQEFVVLHRLGLVHHYPAWQSHLEAHVLPFSGTTTPANAGDLPFLSATVKTVVERNTAVCEPMTQLNITEAADVNDMAEDNDDGEKPRDELCVVSVPDPPTSDAHCHGVIDSIRKEEFGVGISLGVEGQQLMGKQTERLGRALQRLSLELYSSDTHFVLELIQNADDNKYHPGAQATLCFMVDRDGITCINNEVGFTEQNVRALCDVGHSTKPETSGYIGQKGIGFKSVFRITDTPAIHSNGYHFCFDAKHGNIGYILPQWVPPFQVPQHILSSLPQDIQRLTQASHTCIVLPFKPSLSVGALKANFEEIHESLLLFLNRLSRLIIVDATTKAVKIMTRRDLSNGEVEVVCNDHVTRWLLVKKRLVPPPNIRRNDVSVASTELSIAFPLEPALHSSVCLPPQQVFAYLPLRSYGFKFLINADWMVPSSREDVTQHCAWNEWLRDQIPALYTTALQELQPLYGELDAVEMAATVLRFLPLEGEVLGWFRPVGEAIVQNVRNSASLVTSEGDQVLLTQLVCCQDEQTLDLVPAHLLKRLLHLHYIDDTLSNRLPPGVLTTLRINRLHEGHLLDVMEQLLKLDSSDPDRKATVDKDSWLARWMLAVDKMAKTSVSYVTRGNATARHIPRMAAMPIVPLKSGKRVEVRGKEATFFPPPPGTPRYAFERIMRTVRPSFLRDLHEDRNQELRGILLRMGVRQWEPATVLEHHILPLLSMGPCGQEDDILISCLVFVKGVLPHCRRSRDLWKQAQSQLISLATNDGFVQPRRVHVHFTMRYGNPFDLLQMLPNPCLVSECYLSPPDNDVTGWRQFLESLGVTDFLQLTHVQQAIQQDDAEWQSYQWAAINNGVYWVDDWQCDEFLQVVHALVGRVTVRGAYAVGEKEYGMLCKILSTFDAAWDDRYGSAVWKRFTLQRNEDHALHRIPSTFVMHLRTISWVPCATSATGLGTAMHRVAPPSTLYAPTTELRMLLKSQVPWVAIQLQCHAMLDALGIVHRPTVELLLSFLKAWGQPGAGGSGPMGLSPTPFRFSIAQLHAIYGFLHSHLNDHRPTIQEALTANPSIFIPHKVPSNGDEEVEGRWLTPAEVCCRDPSGVMNQYGPPWVLACYYPSCDPLESLFKEISPIANHPTARQYVTAMERVAACLSATNGGAAVMALFNALSTLAPALDSSMLCKLVPQRARILPTTEGHWVSVTSGCVLDDAPHLTRHFGHNGGDAGIFIINIPLASGAAMLVHKLGVPYASAVIKENILFSGPNEDSPLAALVAFAIPYAQRYIATKHSVRYAELKHVPALLQELQCCLVDELGIVRQLGDAKAPCEARQAVWDKNHNILYVKATALREYTAIFQELSCIFFDTTNSDLAYSLTVMALLRVQGNDVEHFARDTERLHTLAPLEHWPLPNAALHSQYTFPVSAEETVPPAPPVMPISAPSLQGEVPPGANPRRSGPMAPRGPRVWPPNTTEIGMAEVSRDASSMSVASGQPGARRPRVDIPAAGRLLRANMTQPLSTDQLMKANMSSPAPANQPHQTPENADGEEEHGGIEVNEAVGSETVTAMEADGEVNATQSEGTDSGHPERSHNTGGKGKGKGGAGGKGHGKGDGDRQHALPLPPGMVDGRLAGAPCYDPQKHAVTIHDVPAELHKHLPELPVYTGRLDEKFAAEVGSWGERLMFSYLQRQYAATPEVKVSWMNAETERFLPYDLTVEGSDENGQPTTTYVEVKSAREHKKQLFEISEQQVRFALRHGVNYHIYCVKGAGREDVQITHIIHPMEQWKQHTITFCLVV